MKIITTQIILLFISVMRSSGDGQDGTTDVIDQIAVPEMCFYCFEVLDAMLNNHDIRSQLNFSNDAHPFFVTWKIGQSKTLRGCIGTFTSLNLHSGLRDFAIKSSLYDSRFSPITRAEFSSLTVIVSILTDFEETRGYLNWTRGVHGIGFISEEPGSAQIITFLPEVAMDAGWDQLRTIDALLRKGGFRGQITPEIRQSLNLYRYRSQKVEMSYAEYSNRLKSVQNYLSQHK